MKNCHAEHEDNLSFMKLFDQFPKSTSLTKMLKNNFKPIQHFYLLVCTVNILKSGILLEVVFLLIYVFKTFLCS